MNWCVALNVLSRNQRSKGLVRRRTIASLFFALVLSVLAFNYCSPIRSIWMKERSSYWLDPVVSSTFSSRDWLENFHISKATFLYVCNEIRPVIEKDSYKKSYSS